ncbi:NAD(P)-binding domain-containing protein [Actinopolymorpha sp. B17G11]|uniref:NAD(P)-dependent oxidoreductase n=1 Tax=unclassified Actinopolymorpha TaxID=2627063 RepID=UPI0032D8FEB9
MNHPPVTVLGLGAMGSALAAALLRGGHPTTVWNRTAGRADPLVAGGAVAAPTAAAAAAASPLVLLSVTDYDASEAVLDAIGAAAGGCALLNLSTGTPDEARAMATRAAKVGLDYLDGVIQAGPSQIGTPAATMFYAGAERTFAEHAATLAELGTPTHVGTDLGQACRWDLALLGLWYETEAAYLNALALVGAPDTDPETFVPFVRRQLGYVVDALPDVAKEIREGRYPVGPATLTEHARVLDQLVRVRRAEGLDTSHAAFLRDSVQRLVARGGGGDGFTRLIEEVADAARR